MFSRWRKLTQTEEGGFRSTSLCLHVPSPRYKLQILVWTLPHFLLHLYQYLQPVDQSFWLAIILYIPCRNLLSSLTNIPHLSGAHSRPGLLSVQDEACYVFREFSSALELSGLKHWWTKVSETGQPNIKILCRPVPQSPPQRACCLQVCVALHPLCTQAHDYPSPVLFCF